MNCILKDTTEILTISAKFSTKHKRLSKRNKPKLQVWNGSIADALGKNRQAHKDCRMNTNHNQAHRLLTKKKETKQLLRSEIRKEHAKRRIQTRVSVMESRSNDSQLFHKLIMKQRSNGNSLITNLHVKNKTFKEQDILLGWREHFRRLTQLRQ